MIVAGIGCRTGVSAEAVLAILRDASDHVMRGRGRPRLAPRIYPSGRPDDIVAPQGVGPRVKPAGDERAAGDMPKHWFLAVPDFRRAEPGIGKAAAALGLPIVWIARDALKGEQGRCLTRSARAQAEVGLSCVAEAAALAGAGPGSRLVLPRIARGGVTCAVAQGQGPAGPSP
jgi:cobalt-precorrin 5A hydrolase